MTAAFGVAAAPAKIVLQGGVTAASVFFAADGAVTIGAGAIVNGIILGAAAVSISAGVAGSATYLTGKFFSRYIQLNYFFNFIDHFTQWWHLSFLLGMAYSQAALSDGGLVITQPPAFCQNPYTGNCLSACSNVCPPGSPAGTGTGPAPSATASRKYKIFVILLKYFRRTNLRFFTPCSFFLANVTYPSHGAVRVNLGYACPFIGVGSTVANTGKLLLNTFSNLLSCFPYLLLFIHSNSFSCNIIWRRFRCYKWRIIRI